MNYQLSIIIPIYNVEEYIVDCLNSLAAQWRPGVEIILVNDGSSDTSAEIIRAQFATELADEKFILIEQENQGVSVARNVGIQQARGSYIGFIDADDIILPDYFCAILESITQHRPDVIEFGWKSFSNINDLDVAEERFVHGNFGKQLALNIRDDIFSKSTWYPCIRVFNKSIACEPLFPIGVRFCEDLMALTRWYEKIDSIYHINKALYGYRTNPSGATLNISPHYVEKLESFYHEILEKNSSHYRYLKISIIYILYRCYEEMGLPLRFSQGMPKDINNIRWQIWRYRSAGRRKILIFMFPVTHFKLKKWLGRL